MAGKTGPVGSYKAKAGSRVTRQQALDLGPILRKLAEAGEATPERLVEVATDPSCPAHVHFEWDDKVAAGKYRVVQAQKYMRSIVVEVVIEDHGPVDIRVVAPDADPEEPWVFVVNEVRDYDDALGPMIRQAQAELRAFQKKYKELRILAETVGLFDSIDEFLAELG